MKFLAVYIYFFATDTGALVYQRWYFKKIHLAAVLYTSIKAHVFSTLINGCLFPTTKIFKNALFIKLW